MSRQDTRPRHYNWDQDPQDQDHWLRTCRSVSRPPCWRQCWVWEAQEHRIVHCLFYKLYREQPSLFLWKHITLNHQQSGYVIVTTVSHDKYMYVCMHLHTYNIEVYNIITCTKVNKNRLNRRRGSMSIVLYRKCFNNEMSKNSTENVFRDYVWNQKYLPLGHPRAVWLVCLQNWHLLSLFHKECWRLGHH